MIRGILADHNVIGQLRTLLVDVFLSNAWLECWADLKLEVYQLEDVGLRETTPDDAIWRLCQREQLVLLTLNRNRKGEESLNAVMDRERQDDSLPVITLSSGQRISDDGIYR